MGTKLNKVRFEVLRKKLGYEGCFTINAIGRSGDLLMLWKEEINFELINYSSHHTSGWVNDLDNNVKWIVTGFYGQPEVSRRKES